MQACYCLDHIHFQELRDELDLDTEDVWWPLMVTTHNANLGACARTGLRRHPRTRREISHRMGMPTESLFAGMHGGDGGGSDWESEDEDEMDEDDEDEMDEDDKYEMDQNCFCTYYMYDDEFY